MTPLDLAPAAAVDPPFPAIDAYARCIAASRRVRWDIETDVIRGRRFDLAHTFLPDGLTLVDRIDCLTADDKRWLGQIQARTYANMFGLVERFIGAKVLEVSRDHWLGDQVALEALVRFGDEELKHQELFRRVETMTAEAMPPGYRFSWDANQVAGAVLAASSWAVLGLTLHIELFTQAHYRESVAPNNNLSPLFKDVLLYHWREESQHAVIDELEWRRIDASLDKAVRDRAVDELISLIGEIDGILQAQARTDSDYFFATAQTALGVVERTFVSASVLRAYRWQYILSGAQHRHFLKVLQELVTEAQAARIMAAITPLASNMPSPTAP